MYPVVKTNVIFVCFYFMLFYQNEKSDLRVNLSEITWIPSFINVFEFHSVVPGLRIQVIFMDLDPNFHLILIQKSLCHYVLCLSNLRIK